MRLRDWMLFALLLSVFGAKAQYSNKIHFRNISAKDGLSFPVVNCVFQDKDGFIWVGTEVGLNRYDSQRFKVYYADPDDPGSLSNDNVLCLFEDNKKRLWAGTLSGLSIFEKDKGTFRKFDDELLGNEKILAITGDKTGNYVVLTQTNLVRVDEELNIIKKYAAEHLSGEEGVTRFSTAGLDREGNIWVNTDRGLRLFDPESEMLSNPLGDNESIFTSNIEFFSTLHFDREGNIWVATRGNGLKYFSPKTGSWQRVENLSSNYINGITIDVNGKVWICTGRNGLNIYDLETKEVDAIRYAEKPESNFVSNSLSCIFSDNQGGIWIGTFNNGLQYHFQHQLKFNLYYSEGQIRGINSNYTTSFAADRNDNLWIGAADEGLLFFDRANKTFRKVTPDIPDMEKYGELKENFYVLSLLFSDDGQHLVVGTLTGIYHFNISTQQWRYFHHQKGGKNTLPGGIVADLLQDGDDIYIANFEGLSVYNLRTGTIKNIEQPVSPFQAISLVKANEAIFVGTKFEGLWKLDNGTGEWQRLKSPNPDIPLPENIRSLLFDKQKRLLIGSDSEGLLRADPDFTVVEKLGSMFQNEKVSFMSMCEDPRSGYWMATSRGLARVNERLDIQKLFDETEGFNPEYFTNNALYMSPGNEIVVGGNSGFCSFFPDNFFSPNPSRVRVQLTDFLLLNKSVVTSEVEGFRVASDLNTDQTIRLPKYRNLITFEYTALDFHNPSRINYSYRLMPYENKWNEVGNRRFATYRDLPPGNYTFQVKLENETIQEDTASLAIILPPKPWLSRWAFLLYGSVLFFLWRQFFLFRKNRRKLRQEVAMQKFENEKMEELYNFKIDFFTQVTHELRTPLTLIIAPLEEMIIRNNYSNDNKLLKMIHRNSQKLLRTVNQVLDFRKIENADMKVFAKKGNIVAFAEEIIYSFLQNAEQKGIELSFETNMESYPFVLFDKDIMEKILVNLIANALKFTQEGKVGLKVFEAQNQSFSSHYFIQIEDTGRGIKEENLSRIFDSFFQEKRDVNLPGSGLGLKMVKELTGLHHGSIEVRSSVNEGTSFVLSFPKADLELMAEEPVKPEISQVISKEAGIEKSVKPLADSSAKILVVDDEEEILEFVQEMFHLDYQVLTVNSAKKAIDVARAEMPDIIISDVMMPEMDGYKLCEYTKDDFLLRHIPVVLLTALKKTENEIEGLKTGADAYISKPFSVELLRATVQNLLLSRQKLKQAFLNSGINKSNVGHLTENNSDQEFIEKVIVLIEEKMEIAGLETSWISNQLGMSSSTFYRKLKSMTGLSGNEFIRTVRLKRALDFLNNTDMNISEIAYRVGFSDPKYFATCFKKQFNATPSEYVAERRGA